MLTMQRIPHAWKRDEAALWICPTGAPGRDLPDDLGRWSSACHCFRRWSVRDWWDLVFEALRRLWRSGALVRNSKLVGFGCASSGRIGPLPRSPDDRCPISRDDLGEKQERVAWRRSVALPGGSA